MVHGEIRAIAHYSGDPSIAVDIETITKALLRLSEAQESYAGYAIDFGVLASGATALVEMNDGFAIGAYTISSQDYTDLVWARWEEILAQAN